MRHAALAFVFCFLAVCLWAQAPQPATPPPAHPHMHGMGAMHQQHLQEMKTQVEKMRATLEEMRAIVAKEKKSPDQELEQKNIVLWDAMIQHMEGMVKMMSDHPPMAMMGGGHPEGMGCCAGMKDAMADGCCGGMKDGGGCCGGNKCMQPAAPEKPAAPGA